MAYNKGEHKREMWKYVFNVMNENEETIDLLSQLENTFKKVSYEVLLYTVYLQKFF